MANLVSTGAGVVGVPTHPHRIGGTAPTSSWMPVSTSSFSLPLTTRIWDLFHAWSKLSVRRKGETNAMSNRDFSRPDRAFRLDRTLFREDPRKKPKRAFTTLASVLRHDPSRRQLSNRVRSGAHYLWPIETLDPARPPGLLYLLRFLLPSAPYRPKRVLGSWNACARSLRREHGDHGGQVHVGCPFV